VPSKRSGASLRCHRRGRQLQAGFLYGMATGRDLLNMRQMGQLSCAAKVISTIGPRPQNLDDGPVQQSKGCLIA